MGRNQEQGKAAINFVASNVPAAAKKKCQAAAEKALLVPSTPRDGKPNPPNPPSKLMEKNELTTASKLMENEDENPSPPSPRSKLMENDEVTTVSKLM